MKHRNDSSFPGGSKDHDEHQSYYSGANPSALGRTETQATWGLSSSDDSLSQQSRRRDTSPDDDDMERDDRVDFARLSDMSAKYRRECRELEHRSKACLLRLERSGVFRVGSPLMELLESALYQVPEDDLLDNRKLPARKPAPPQDTQARCPPTFQASQSLPLPRARQEPTAQPFTIDSKEIRRQQQILDDIQRSRSSATAQTRLSSAVSAGCVGSVHGRGASRRPQESLPPPNNKTRPSFNTGFQVEDQVAHVGGGQRIRIKGTQHTFKSIARGEATLVQCPTCKTILQVSQKAKLLYCTLCDQVSPIVPMSVDQAAGISSSTHLDTNIARNLQQTEDSLARKQKHAAAAAAVRG